MFCKINILFHSTDGSIRIITNFVKEILKWNTIMANRAANPVLFGFDFQVNAAIVLMLENIKDMSSIRLEGAEDIEINLNDGSCVLAQAKAVVKSSTDFTKLKSRRVKRRAQYKIQ